MSLSSLQAATAVVLSVVGVFAAQSVFAADTVPLDQARFDHQSASPWRGAYWGVHLGALAAGGAIENGTISGKFENSAGLLGFGGHLGYNFTPFNTGPNGGWMLGAEIDVSAAGFKNRKSSTILGDTQLSGTFVGSARLRAGYAWEKVYLYSTFGLAVSDVNLKPVGAGDTDISAGAVFGVGLEVALNEIWTGRVEALAYDFGAPEREFSGVTRKVDQGMGTIRFGISRKF